MNATRRETAGSGAGGGSAAAPGVAGWLGLAAAPTFAVMALLAAVPGGGPPDMLCGAGPDASPLGGMASMYMLMSVFHAAPWLRLLSRRARSGVRAPIPAPPLSRM